MPKYSVRVGGHEIFKVDLEQQDRDFKKKRIRIAELIGVPLDYVRFQRIDGQTGKIKAQRQWAMMYDKKLDKTVRLKNPVKHPHDYTLRLKIKEARRKTRRIKTATGRTIYTLLSQGDRHPKTSKNGDVLNIHSRILHLAPAKSSGINVCPMHSQGCAAACLNWAGFKYAKKQQSRVAKTLMFYYERELFMDRLAVEIAASYETANKRGMICGIRLNGTSDIRFESIAWQGYTNLMEAFPDVCFMDYTKISNRRNLPDNYRLTFSRSEDNDNKCHEALYNGINVAVVFRNKLPETFWGLPVIDGDLHDWRYGDYEDHDGCVIVGLRAKGRAKFDRSGFVVDT